MLVRRLGGGFRLFASTLVPSAKCRNGRIALGGLDVSSLTVAYTDVVRSCGTGPPRYTQRLLVQPVSGAAPARVIARASSSSVNWSAPQTRISGRLVAWEPIEGGRTVLSVYDWRTRTKMTDLATEGAPSFNGGVAGFDIQGDGTIVAADTDDHVFWLTPGMAPTVVSRLAVPSRIELASGAAVLQAERRGGGAALYLLNRSGESRVLATFPDDYDHTFAWDGHALTWERFDPTGRGRRTWDDSRYSIYWRPIR